jgi:hypothetical protein
MRVQAGAETVDEGDCTDVQGCLIRLRRQTPRPLQE